MCCHHCGGTLYRDRTSERDALLQGYSGGRIYCLNGCTDKWDLVWMARNDPLPFTAGHQYRQRVCKTDGKPFKTKAWNAQRCPEHAKANRVARSKVYWKRHEERRRRAEAVA